MSRDKIRTILTERQYQIWERNEQGFSDYKAAQDLGISRSTIRSAMREIKKKLDLHAIAPERNLAAEIPEGYKLKGFSNYYKGTKDSPAQWVKLEEDRKAQEDLRKIAYDAMCKEIPKWDPTPQPQKNLEENLCNLLVFTDYHMGQLSWGKETGEDWDIKIASQLLLNSFANLIQRAPDAKTLVFVLQGDFFHTNGFVAATPEHHNVLDADGRFPKIVDAAITIVLQILRNALLMYDNVHVKVVAGNHDPEASMWFRKMLKAIFENENRLEVDDSEMLYYTYQHGNVMLGFHHGHKVSNEQLPMLFAAQFPRIWGNCLKRYIHTGHRHHADEKEYAGAIVTQHTTLVARDAYAARGGWFSERAANLITYHKRYGQVSRTIVTPEMFDE